MLERDANRSFTLLFLEFASCIFGFFPMIFNKRLRATNARELLPLE